MTNTISPRKASLAFAAILETIGRDDLTDILFNWNDSELNEDGTKIFLYVGRDREYSRGKEAGKSIVSKKEFIEWLLSDGPFDENEYGKDIKDNVDWTDKIERSRRASGLLARDAQ